MGDIADLTAEGGLCCACGATIDGDAPGYLRLCGDCQTDEDKLDALNFDWMKNHG